jgi:tripartite ATP-independent transporter DctP family solute receptor
MNQVMKSALGAVVGLALATFAAPAGAQQTLIFGGSDTIGSLLDRQNALFTKLVNERATGKLRINFIQGEQLGPDMAVIEQMMQGSVHFYGDVLGWYGNFVKDFSILNWGFTFRDNEHLQKFIESDVYKSITEELRTKQGLRVLAAAPAQPRIMFSKNEIKTPGDLTNLKMRVPDIRTYLLLWETMGTKPTRVAWGEVFLGLKTGLIEAAEGPVSAAYAAKMHQAVKYVVRTDHLISDVHITMNEKTYVSLAPDLQKILVDAAREATQWSRKQAEEETEEVVKKMGAEGATIVKVDPAPFAAKARAAVATMENEGAWSKGLWEKIVNLK